MSGSAKNGHHVASEFHIDSFAFGLIRPLEVRSVAFGGVMLAGAAGLAALHNALKNRPFAEVLQFLKFPFERLKASRVAIGDHG